MKRIFLVTTLLITATLMTGFSTNLFSHGPGGPHHQWICDQLTDDQKEELHATVDAMREEGATRCEIHDAVREMAEGWGVEVPDPPFGHQGLRGIFDLLTEEQNAEVHEVVETMTAEGASPCEIHETVREMVEGYGIEIPERHGERHRHGGW